MSKDLLKKKVHDFWNDSSCGEELYLEGQTRSDYENHSKKDMNLRVS